MIDQVLDVITKIATLILAIYTIVVFVRTWRKHGFLRAVGALFSTKIILPIMLVLALGFASLALVFIEPTQVGVVISIFTRQGIRDQPMRSGLNWIVPLAERVEIYPLVWETYTMSATPGEGDQVGDDSINARTKDGQEIHLDVSTIFRLDPEQVIRIHIDWQHRYTEDLVRPIIQGFVRSQVSQFTVEEVNSDKRNDLQAILDQLLRVELDDKGLILDQFLLRAVSFSEQYSLSVEAKQVALEGIQEKEYEAQQIRELSQGNADAVEIEAKGNAAAILIEAESQAKARIVEAEAQATALVVIGEALQGNNEILTHEYIDKLAPNIQVMLLPANAPFIFPLPTFAPTYPLTSTQNITSTLSTTPTPIGVTVTPTPQPSSNAPFP